eukprot:TRINITY_DN17571_c0_g1_i1.p1 TRINITY_DN17571_c0_g1~~TRINITY_DN17571_c0_g1_i1.p1  ORF type:complete len:316 (+),score=112.35 TRINITY_DN17571_c0_g1_i1:215-1162(+)
MASSVATFGVQSLSKAAFGVATRGDVASSGPQMAFFSGVCTPARAGHLKASAFLSGVEGFKQQDRKAGCMRRVQATRPGVVAQAAAGELDVPTVADTKAAFLAAYKKPIPSIYNNVLQELLVLHHFVRFNSDYKYDPIFALGLVTVYDQLFDGYRNGAEEKETIFKAYINALQESPEQYRNDAEALEEWAGAQSAESVLKFDGDSAAEKAMQDVSTRAKEGNFHYSRFFAIGLFRILNLAKASDPATLEKLTSALNVSKASVDRDLDIYRGLLTKLAAAKELLQEFLEREQKKAAERKAEQEAKAVPSTPAAESS